jgi:ornithine cyclodeaminase/alanine dehydrogenase-like protein (mu-crystallin family)
MSDNKQIPYLSETDLAALGLTTRDVVDCIEAAIVGCDHGTVWSAPKAVIQPGDGRYMMAALAAADDPPYLAVKTVVLNPRNSERGLPQINGLVTMLDSETGLPAAILDGNWITAVRTAGLSAVAARRMAREDSSVVASIGSGVQARSHLTAFAELFPLRELRVFGRGQANIDSLCEMAESLSIKPVRCDDPAEAMRPADLVVTSVTHTAVTEPFLDAGDLKPGAFAAIVDLAAPWIRESFALLDRIAIDDLEQEASLPNKLAAPEFISGDLSGLVLGKFSGRDNAEQRTAFIFRGHALGDLALAGLAFDKSRAAG